MKQSLIKAAKVTAAWPCTSVLLKIKVTVINITLVTEIHGLA